MQTFLEILRMIGFPSLGPLRLSAVPDYGESIMPLRGCGLPKTGVEFVERNFDALPH
jgi:hypothetical protein